MAAFRKGSWFASKKVLQEYVLLLEQYLQRKCCAGGNNGPRYQAFHCSTRTGKGKVKKKPAHVPGVCQFYIMGVIQDDGSVIIMESNLAHTTCRTDTNIAATRNLFTVPKRMAREAAAYAVRQAQRGLQSAYVEDYIKRLGYSIPPNAVARALAEMNSDGCLENETYGTLVSYFRAFDAAHESNFATVETDSNGSFERALAVMGRDNVRDGLVSSVISCDFAYVKGSARVEDAFSVLEESLDDERDHYDEEDIDESRCPSSRAPVKGRPKKTSVGLGRLVVCMGRTYAGQRVLLAIGLVSSETTANAEWFLRIVEREIGLVAKFGVVNFITDRSSAIRSAIALVYGDRATSSFCYVHFRRNVIQHTSGDKYVKARVYACLNKIFHATTDKKFEEGMQEIKELNSDAYNYLRTIERSSWVPLFFSFNPLNNVTSNDAESLFAGVSKPKSAGHVVRCLTKTIHEESQKVFRMMKDSEKQVALMAFTVLEETYQARMTEAQRMVCVSQHHRDAMNLAERSCSEATFSVDLRNLWIRRLWCSCLVSAWDSLPCAHVLAAIICFGALEHAVELVLYEGTLRRTDGRPRVHPVIAPPTHGLIPDKSIRRPWWSDVTVTAEYIPSGAMERARPVRRYSETSHYPRKPGSRIPSQGEAATKDAASEQSRHDARQQKFKIAVGTSAPNAAFVATQNAVSSEVDKADLSSVGQ